MDNKKPVGKVEKVYLQYMATGIKCAQLKEQLEVPVDAWMAFFDLIEADKPLPPHYAKYNQLFNLMKSHTRLCQWLAENLHGKNAEEFTSIVKKYGDLTEAEFIEKFKQYKEQEKQGGDTG